MSGRNARNIRAYADGQNLFSTLEPEFQSIILGGVRYEVKKRGRVLGCRFYGDSRHLRVRSMAEKLGFSCIFSDGNMDEHLIGDALRDIESDPYMDTVAIASGDDDMMEVVETARKRGMMTIGIGFTGSSSDSFRNEFNRWISLGRTLRDKKAMTSVARSILEQKYRIEPRPALSVA